MRASPRAKKSKTVKIKLDTSAATSTESEAFPKAKAVGKSALASDKMTALTAQYALNLIANFLSICVTPFTLHIQNRSNGIMLSNAISHSGIILKDES